VLAAIESELYDAYACNALTPERRRVFEQKFLATPEQRKRLQFAHALLASRSSAGRSSNLFLSGRRKTLGAIGLAAAAVLAVAIWRGISPVQPEQAGQAPVRPLAVVAFALSDGITRDGADEPTLEIPAGTDVVRVTASLSEDSRPISLASLRTPEGKDVWTTDSTRPPTADSRSTVIVEIPASAFANGHYILTLNAAKADGTLEEVADYAFLVRLP
jgi:hypothetical protein